MDRTLIKDLKENLNKEVLLKGWVQDVRNLSKIKFIILRDRSGDMQTLAIKSKTDQTVFENIDNVTPESVIELTGTPKENKESKWGIEVLISNLKILSIAKTPLPVDNSDKSQTNIDKRIDHRFLDVRNKKINAIFRIRSKIANILTNFLNSQDFIQIQTPKLTGIGVESGAEVFELNYFGKKAFLAQSPQIYKQMFMNAGFERVYELGSVFRAENSNTTRHLTEFVGIDLEMAFIKDENELMDFAQKMFIHLIKELKDSPELKILNVDLKVPKQIPKISIKEAKELLKEKGKTYNEDDDLDPEGEKIIGEIMLEKYDSIFVFLTDFPWIIRPFYHMKKDNLTKSFDLICNGVEICTGAQREHRLNILKDQAKEKEINLNDMNSYLEIFEYGIPPHGGIGFGLDRITQVLLNLKNVREAVLLPRDPDRLTP